MRTAIVPGQPQSAPETTFAERRLAEYIHAAVQWGYGNIPKRFFPRPHEIRNIDDAVRFVKCRLCRDLYNQIDPGQEWIFWSGDFGKCSCFAKVAEDGSMAIRIFHVWDKPNLFGFQFKDGLGWRQEEKNDWKYEWLEFAVEPISSFITSGSALEW
jgi:hypothetical protein